MTNPSDSRPPRKPTKPREDFPLTPRADGRWQKKIYGKVCIFSGSAEEALAKYEAKLEEMGKAPEGQQQIRHLCESFMVAQLRKLENNELGQRTFNEYHATCDTIVAYFGRLRPLEDLTANDAELFRERLTKGLSLTTQEGRIRNARIVFRFGTVNQLMTQSFHLWLRPIGKKVLKQFKVKQPSRKLTPEEIKLLLGSASVPMKAMLLLAVNAGFGNSDCSDLESRWLDLDNGWSNFPRFKTGEPRKAKLWPVTVAAIREAIAKRPAPKTTELADRVFLTRCGRQWVLPAGKDDAVAKEFSKLATKVGIKRPGMSFYSLRHCFETEAGNCRDQVAVDLVMGHVVPGMGTNYRHGIDDARLVDVADHVHKWLYGRKMPRGKTALKVVG